MSLSRRRPQHLHALLIGHGMDFGAHHGVRERLKVCGRASASLSGIALDKALSAEREHPELDDAVWILKCGNASYSVRLIPDMAAKVERLD